MKKQLIIDMQGDETEIDKYIEHIFEIAMEYELTLSDEEKILEE